MPVQNQSDTTQQEDNKPKGIDYDHVEETDSALLGAVVQFQRSFRSANVDSYGHPSFSPTGLAYPDRLHHVFTPYSLTAGTMGHPHLSLLAAPYRGDFVPEGFQSWYQPPQLQGYAFMLPSISFYQTSRPYTRIGYGGSLNKDNTLAITHTQNVRPRWNVAIDYSLIRRTGVYTRSGVSDNSIAISSNYYSRDSRYQLQAALIYNNMYSEENGGVASDEQYRLSGHSNLAGIPVNLYNASSRCKMVEAYIHQTFNTVRLFDRIDTVWIDSSDFRLDTLRADQPKALNSGIFGLDIDYTHLNRIYLDRTADDSLSHRLAGLRADLYWTNEQSRWESPFRITIGLTADLPTDYSPSLKAYTMRLIPFVKAEILSLLQLSADYDLLSGDYLTAVGISKSGFALTASASNCRPQWQYDYYGKMQMQKAEVAYRLDQQWFTGRIALSAAQARQHYWLNSQLLTQSTSEATPLLQGHLMGTLRLGWMHYEMQHLFQYADQELIRCPLYASKNSLYADFHLFHNALHANVGFDLRYHTAFYADAYDPATGLFYRQDDTQVGNHPWLDAFVTLRIKQANIYLRATHINYFLGSERNDFILPHYPGEDLGVYFGLVWQFFN